MSSDTLQADIPQGDPMDNDYKSRTGQNEIHVQADDKPVEDPIDADVADSDEQLAKDDEEAISKDNIVEGRTRGAKPSGGYTEPGDEEGLPGPDNGKSAIAQ